MAKKKKGSRLIERLAKVPDRTWKLICLIAVLVLLTPVAIDILIPDRSPDSSNTDPKDLIIIRDDAELLTEEEEKELYGHMLPITEYGGAAFVSSYNSSSTESYAKKCYREYFGTKSGTLFLIDMYNRQIYIFSDGKIFTKVTKARARTITDNAYRLATNGDYLGCAEKVFNQMATILSGGFIPQYMKHICNALISFAIGLLSVFTVANARTRMQSDNEVKVFNEMAKKGLAVGAPVSSELISIKKTRYYEDSGGGGSSGGGGGSSGGGGGSSGGGGGHGF